MIAEPTGWRKSGRSGQNTACVEVGRTSSGGAAVRDSKDRAAGYFTASPQQWRQFLAAIKRDHLD